MSDEIAPLIWPNNANTTMARDRRGVAQNIAFFDNDDGVQYGPDDPRLQNYFQTPVNLFRPHVVSDFYEATLDPKWVWTAAGSGSYSMANGCVNINAGDGAVGSGGSLNAPNVTVHFVPGQKLYWYLTTYPNGNLDLEFGVKIGNNKISWHRTEDDVAQVWNTETQRSGYTTYTSTDVPGNDVRRCFCIHYKAANAVDFYAGDDWGRLQLRAWHTTNIPDANDGVAAPFVNFYGRYANAPRTLALDVFYGVLVR